jgi:DNA/RNA endonuclease G (NUC1)
MKKIFLTVIFLISCLIAIAQPDMKFCPKSKIVTLHYTQFVIDYDTIRQLPCFVYYEVKASMKHGYSRSATFHKDARIHKQSSYLGYRLSGYDIGHMFPAANSESQTIEGQSFSFTNTCPQTKKLNRGSWKDLEEWERKQTTNIFVICGPIGGITKLKDGTVIPEKFFKIIIENGNYKYYIFSQNSEGDFRKFEVTKQEFEKIVKL